MKKPSIIIPDSWYFCIGYHILILLSLLFFITVVQDGYYAWKDNDTRTIMGMCIGVPACLLLPISLIVTRAVNLAKIYILTGNYIKVYVPFRKVKKLEYYNFRYISITNARYGMFGVESPYLCLSSRGLSRFEQDHAASIDANATVVTLRLTPNRRRQLKEILPLKMSKML